MGQRRRLASSPALAMITATGGIATATTDITTAAVTEYNRTTAQDRTNRARQSAIKTKYSRLRTGIGYPWSPRLPGFVAAAWLAPAYPGPRQDGPLIEGEREVFPPTRYGE